MPLKITLITPPDIYQNDVLSIMFVDISEEEQDSVSKWLSNSNIDMPVNIYFYQGEPNVPWFLHSLACCQYKYINLNNVSAVSSYLSGYVLSKSGVFYKIDDKNIAELYSHINYNKIENTDEFLERIFSGKD